jgi:lysine 2,3-aminomutase
LEDAEEYRATGIEKLLSDSCDTISLTPENNDRLKRRNQ